MCTVILNKNDYVCKVDKIIENGICEGKYIETTDNTLCDLKQSQDFLYRHFHKNRNYEVMRPHSDQPDRYFATADTEDIY